MCHWIGKQFRRIWLPSEVLFNIFFSAFLSVIAVIVALRLAGATGIAVTYFWVAVAVFGVCAILTLIRIQLEPKDTRLDTLSKEVTTLTKAIRELTEEIQKEKRGEK